MKEEKNRLILEAAQEEFLGKGFGFASMQNIAEAAGVSKRTLYKYYPEKERLYDTLVERLFDQVQRDQKFPYSKDEDIEFLLREILDIKIQLLTDKNFLKIVSIIFSEQLKKADLNKDLLNRLDSSRLLFKDWLNLCIKDGKIRTEESIDLMSDYFHSTVDGMILFPIVLGMRGRFTRGELRDIKELIMKAFLKAFVN